MWKQLLAITGLLTWIPGVWYPYASLQGTAASVGQSLVSDLPKPVDYVSDFAHVLSRSVIDEVDRICSDLDHSKADTQIAVVTIKSLNGADVSEYATSLANTWGVGKKGTNRGVLLLLAINDHKWRIAVGRGLEGIVPNSKADEIGQKMIPLLRAKDFNGAVTIAVREIAHAVSP